MLKDNCYFSQNSNYAEKISDKIKQEQISRMLFGLKVLDFKESIMSYTIAPNEVIDYPAEKLREFHSYGFEYIDNRLFCIPAEKLLGTRTAYSYVQIAKSRFFDMGWNGDGEVELFWLPSFVFPFKWNVPPTGVVIWHVKQSEDGISYLLSPIELPFEEFKENG